MADFSGSDVAEKVGWSEDTMLALFTRFVCERGHEDEWLAFLNDLADEELAEASMCPHCGEPEHVLFCNKPPHIDADTWALMSDEDRRHAERAFVAAGGQYPAYEDEQGEVEDEKEGDLDGPLTDG